MHEYCVFEGVVCTCVSACDVIVAFCVHFPASSAAFSGTTLQELLPPPLRFLTCFLSHSFPLRFLISFSVTFVSLTFSHTWFLCIYVFTLRFLICSLSHSFTLRFLSLRGLHRVLSGVLWEYIPRATVGARYVGAHDTVEPRWFSVGVHAEPLGVEMCWSSHGRGLYAVVPGLAAPIQQE